MDDGFDKLRDLLKNQPYPSQYLFKFIVKSDFKDMVALKNCFSEIAEFEKHPSSKGNWVSLSIKEMMLSTEAIIERYKCVQRFENVIAL